MIGRTVVVGASDAVVRAGAVLAGAGAEVRVLRLGAPETEAAPPFGRGAVGIADSALAPRLERIWGGLALVQGGAARRALWLDGRIIDLPLSAAALVRVGLAGGIVGVSVVKARAMARVRATLGTPRAAASYRDALVARVGERFFDRWLGPYVRARFLVDATDLDVRLAQWVHGRPAAKRWVAPAQGQAMARAFQRDAVLDCGGEVLDDVRLEGIEVDAGRAVAVLTEAGRDRVDRTVYTELSPRELAARLGSTVDLAWRSDLDLLEAAHAVQVTLPVRGEERLPWELHVLGDGWPFWRVTRPGALPGEDRWRGYVSVQLTARDLDPTPEPMLVDRVRTALGRIVAVESGPAIVQRRSFSVPLVRIGSLAGLRRRLDAMDGLGIVGIGTRGAFRPLDQGQELAWVDGQLQLGSQRAVHRMLSEERVEPRLRSIIVD